MELLLNAQMAARNGIQRMSYTAKTARQLNAQTVPKDDT
jgi:hypothetical protein